MTRPARSVSASSHFPAGEARTPAAQMIVRASIRSSPSVTPLSSQAVTALLEHDLGADPLERRFGIVGELRIEGREQPRPGLDQNDARVARIDIAEIGGERPLGELGDRAGHLDAGRAAADHDEGQEPLPLGLVALGLGALEGDQDAAAKLGRVLDLLQAGRRVFPFVVAEISVPRAGREDQVVVADRRRGRS